MWNEKLQRNFSSTSFLQIVARRAGKDCPARGAIKKRVNKTYIDEFFTKDKEKTSQYNNYRRVFLRKAKKNKEANILP